MRALAGGVLSAILLGPLAWSSAAQTRAVSVGVADAGGHPARGLRAADFEITEDGRHIQVQASSLVDIAKDAPDGRSYFLVVDGFHLSPRGARRVQSLLDQFVAEDILPGDRAAVAWLGSPPRISAFTTDRHPDVLAAHVRGQSHPP
jgi:hypothetical protein